MYWTFKDKIVKIDSIDAITLDAINITIETANTQITVPIDDYYNKVESDTLQEALKRYWSNYPKRKSMEALEELKGE